MKVKNTQQDPKEKQIRREEFIKQSKEIEKVLLPHGETLQESPEELEEAYKRMISYLKESGVYEEDGPAHRSTNTATGSSRSRKAMRFLAKMRSNCNTLWRKSLCFKHAKRSQQSVFYGYGKLSDWERYTN